MGRVGKIIALVVICTLIPGLADELVIALFALGMWLFKGKEA